MRHPESGRAVRGGEADRFVDALTPCDGFEHMARALRDRKRHHPIGHAPRALGADRRSRGAVQGAGAEPFRLLRRPAPVSGRDWCRALAPVGERQRTDAEFAQYLGRRPVCLMPGEAGGVSRVPVAWLRDRTAGHTGSSGQRIERAAMPGNDLPPADRSGPVRLRAKRVQRTTTHFLHLAIPQPRDAGRLPRLALAIPESNNTNPNRGTRHG